MFRLHSLLICFIALLTLNSCLYSPSLNYTEWKEVKAEREMLVQHLLDLLPASQRKQKAAREEARWLAETSYKAAAAIARFNRPRYTSWMNNRLVNSPRNRKERGLCWHYQHDMYRELRRRPLKYYHLGCCVSDLNRGTEHHAVYAAAKGKSLPNAIGLDAWIFNGRLEFYLPATMAAEKWEDEPATLRFLQKQYPEKHQKPMEHWARVKSDRYPRTYVDSDTPAGRATRQGKLMQENIRKGLQARKGKLTNY